MIKRTPSVQKAYEDCFLQDPALKQPPAAPGKDATDEAKADFKTAIEEYRRLVGVARDRGDWAALLAGETEPTFWRMQPLSPAQFQYIRDLEGLRDKHGDRRYSPETLATLAFRASLVGIRNFDTVEILRDAEPTGDLGRLVSDDFWEGCHPLGALKIQMTLGFEVLRRASSLDPKS